MTNKQYVVRETVHLITYVEADSPEHATEIVKGQGVSEYDDIEQLPMGSQTITVEEVTPAPVEFAPLMVDDTTRVEVALRWLQDYGNALDDIEASPNGDDWNDTVQGITSILRDGVVPPVRLKTMGR